MFGKMRHIWSDKRIHLNLRLRLQLYTYINQVYTVSWRMGPRPDSWATRSWLRALNGVNSQMLSINTVKSSHVEAHTHTHTRTHAHTHTFDILRWIRVRRLQWFGHILRMTHERKWKQSVYELYKSPKSGRQSVDGCTKISIVERRTDDLCSRQPRSIEKCDVWMWRNWNRQTCWTWQLVSIHSDQLGWMTCWVTMVSKTQPCITTTSGTAHTNHTTITISTISQQSQNVSQVVLHSLHSALSLS